MHSVFVAPVVRYHTFGGLLTATCYATMANAVAAVARTIELLALHTIELLALHTSGNMYVTRSLHVCSNLVCVYGHHINTVLFVVVGVCRIAVAMNKCDVNGLPTRAPRLAAQLANVFVLGT
jgi:hypothetical protein